MAKGGIYRLYRRSIVEYKTFVVKKNKRGDIVIIIAAWSNANRDVISLEGLSK